MKDTIELEEPAASEALSLSGLDIMCAGVEGGVFAAHGDDQSFVAFKYSDDDITVWKLVGGSKDERQAHAARIRSTLCSHESGAFKMIPEA